MVAPLYVGNRRISKRGGSLYKGIEPNEVVLLVIGHFLLLVWRINQGSVAQRSSHRTIGPEAVLIEGPLIPGCALESAMRHCDLEDRYPRVAIESGYLMTSSNAHVPPEAEAGPSDLNGLRVLVVEDAWHVGTAMKSLLRAWGADVIGPVATTVDAVRLISEQAPDVALVDVNLRGGELAYGLIDQLHGQGIRVVVTSGYTDVLLASGKAAAVLQKPVSEAQLLASLRPITTDKTALE
jgi:CheY-like chemotaxis protein